MKLNQVEKFLMNNPLRAFSQKYFEASLLKRLGGEVANQNVLEIGCGRGDGIKIILNNFKAKKVTGLDLDDHMIQLAKKRLSKLSDSRVELLVGNADKLPFKDHTFDAVFDFGIIHHVPEWKKVVKEVSRVLKPNGKFFFEEVTKQGLDRWFFKTFLLHPEKDRFNKDEFICELEQVGLYAKNNPIELIFGDYIVGFAQKTG